MTDAPKRIWLYVDTSDDGEQYLELIPEDAHSNTDVEYILASEHAALIREAEARGRINGLIEAEKIAAGVAGNTKAFNADRRGGAGEVQAAIRAAKATP